MRWIESGGGPLIVVPKVALAAWGGSGDSDSAELEDLGDYSRACAVTEYADVIDEGGTQALVLNDDPAATTYLSDRRVFVRRLAAESDAAVAEFVEREFGDLRWEDELRWRVEGECLLFDSSFSGAEINFTEYLEIPLESASYLVHTANIERDDVWLSLTRLMPV
jgi:hypothetical protein